MLMFTVCEWEINGGSSCLNTLYVNVQREVKSMARTPYESLNTLYVNVKLQHGLCWLMKKQSLNTLYVNVQHGYIGGIKGYV